MCQTKTDSARARILEINPHCLVDVYEKALSRDNALEIIQPYDIVCDCTDNFPSRYLVNDACVLLGKPSIYGSIHRFEGQATVFNLDAESPNYRDLVPEPPPAGLVPSCVEGGVMGILPGLIGLIQSTEVIKIITGIGTSLSGRLLVVDALAMTFREMSLRPSQPRVVIDQLIDYQDFCGSGADEPDKEKASELESISVKELKFLLNLDAEDFALVDVRHPSEAEIACIAGSVLIPLNKIESGEEIERVRHLASGRRLFVYCKSGVRSAKALEKLKDHGIRGINVVGGFDAWKRHVDSKDT